MLVIDIHIHTSSPGAVYRPEEAEDAIRLGRRSGIDRVVYLFNLGSGGPDPSPEDIVASNDLGMQLIDAHPDFFMGFCYLNPSHDLEFSLNEIERCVVNGNMCGIKLWIAVHADDARLDPIMERAAALQIPVLHHAWYKMTEYAFNESTAAEIAHLARRHPDVTIIMAHLAGVRWRGVLDVKPYPNVVVDTSGAQPEAELVEYAVSELGADRVLYGSDWPIRDFAVQKARVTGARLDEATKRKILGENAARILKIDMNEEAVHHA